MRARQLRLGARPQDLVTATDFKMAGTDNTGSMASEENGFAGAFAQVTATCGR
eukprot:COSAG02_NODE_7080_length_3194_cov_3.346189_1_plen_53_part_00